MRSRTTASCGSTARPGRSWESLSPAAVAGWQPVRRQCQIEQPGHFPLRGAERGQPGAYLGNFVPAGSGGVLTDPDGNGFSLTFALTGLLPADGSASGV